MNQKYISLEKAKEILRKKGKSYSRPYLNSLARQKKLKAVKVNNKWMTSENWLKQFFKKESNKKQFNLESLNLKFQQVFQEKEKEDKGIILPLYFGYGLRIALVKLSNNTLNLTSRVFKRYWQEATALVVLIAMVSSWLYFYPSETVLGATYNWVQTDWSGGADTENFPDHDNNQTGWTKYYEKDSAVSASTELTLTIASSSQTQTTDTDFNAGSHTLTEVSGTGESADLILDPPAAGASLENSSSNSLCDNEDSSSLNSEANRRKKILNSLFDLSKGINRKLLKGINQIISFFSIQPVYAAFSCDSGDLDTTCYVSSSKTLDDEETVTGTGNLVIQNGGDLTAAATEQFTIDLDGDITIESGGKITGNCDVSSANLTINSGGEIDVDQKGYAGGNGASAGSGPGGGAGTTVNNQWAGGGGSGYGEEGGDSINSAAGGSFYGSSTEPADFGSGGGGEYDTAFATHSTSGGSGGGAIKLNVSGTLTINGTITVNGGNGGNNTCDNFASGACGGGGSGGSVWIIANTITGTSSITANGGLGAGESGRKGGGGAGGRVAISVTGGKSGCAFAGTISVDGGAGYQAGEDGTTYISGCYVSSGSFISSVIDTSQYSDFTTLEWSVTTTAETSIQFQLSSSEDNISWTDFFGPDGTDSTYYTSSGTAIHSNHDQDRYIKYKAYLTTSSDFATPYLHSITINYQYYPNVTLTSSPYDTGDAANILNQVSWTETLLADTDIKFQLRTAPDSSGSPGAWTSWMGTDGTDSTYFTDYTGGETVPSALSDGSNDQWIQYKVFLVSTGTNAPTLSDVTLQYVVNAPPEFNSDYPSASAGGVSASQQSDTTVELSYSIKDVDTTSGTVTPNYVTPSFEYSLNGGTDWDDVGAAYITWEDAPTGGEITDTNTDGDMDNKVLEGSYLIYTLSWDAQAQLGFETNTSTGQIRVTIDDNEAANNTAIQASANFSLDTRPLSNITASQSETEATRGKVEVSYDYNVSSGVESSATISLQYWNGASWSATSTTAGDIGSGVSSGSGKAISWTAKDDYSGQYTTSMKIRVIASYSTTSQNVESSNFEFDTANPTISFYIDAKNSIPPTTAATLHVTASDDSAVQMMLSNNADFSADGLNDDSGQYIDVAASKSWKLATEQTTVYLKVRDKYGNQTTSNQVPPRKPVNLFFRDVSNPDVSEYRLFIAWGTITNPNPGFKHYKIC